MVCDFFFDEKEYASTFDAIVLPGVIFFKFPIFGGCLRVDLCFCDYCYINIIFDAVVVPYKLFSFIIEALDIMCD